MLNWFVRLPHMNWFSPEEITIKGDGPKAKKAPSKTALVNAQTKVRKKMATLTARRGGKIEVQWPTSLPSNDPGIFVGKFANIPHMMPPVNTK